MLATSLQRHIRLGHRDQAPMTVPFDTNQQGIKMEQENSLPMDHHNQEQIDQLFYQFNDQVVTVLLIFVFFTLI